MARPWRIQYEDAVYHVMARGNNRQAIFVTHEDREDFLGLAGRCAEQYELKIFAFCLMPNHYHLFLQTPKANLAEAMHWLNATYAIRFLHRHKRLGHFLQGRYKAVLVTDDEHWRYLSFYLHLNPVRAGLAQNPAEYEWSSYRDYTRFSPRFPWLLRDAILDGYSGSRLSRRNLYRRECLELVGEKPEFWEIARDSVVIGSREALDRLLQRYAPSGNPKQVPDYRKAHHANLNLDQETAKVANAFQVAPHDLKRKRRNFPPRQALFYHLVENCKFQTTMVAQRLAVSPMAVSKAARQFKEVLMHDKKLQKKIHSLKFKVET